MENMPTRSLGRSSDGGRGYTDAYGNRVENHPPAEDKGRKRLRKGGYGGAAETGKNHTLPDPDAKSSSPLWKF